MSSFAGSYDDFFRAVIQDDAATVGQLIARGFDPNTPDPNGQPALVTAVRQPANEVFQLLIKARGLRVDEPNAANETALMLACLAGHKAMVQALMKLDADVNRPGWAPLHYAATKSDPQIIQWLLDESAYIDAESPNGTTPLMMAARYGTTEAVRMLLEAGADASLKNQIGLTALDFARQAQRPDAVALLSELAKKSKPQGQW